MKTKQFLLVFLASLMFVFLLTTIGYSEATLEKEAWRISTQSPGNWTHTVGTGLARIVDKYAKGVKLLVTIAPGSVATHYLYEKNELDAVYGSNLDLLKNYKNEGWFADKPVKYKAYQGIYLTAAAFFVLTTADKADINSYRDLSGKKLFPYKSGSGAYSAVKTVLEALDVWSKIKDRQVGIMEISDSFKINAIDAVGVYMAGTNMAPFLQEMDRRTKLKALVPTQEEREIILNIPGMSEILIPAKVFSQKLNVDNIWGFGNGYGWHYGPNEDAERVYQIVKVMFEHKDELLAISNGFKEFAEKGHKMQVSFYDAMPGIPIHPGVAKYFKEQGWWKENWIIGDLYPRPKK
jgi:TRAP transporter TAXI family solute receptor